MKVIALETPGKKPSMVVKRARVPALGATDVLVKVTACGLCYHDVAVMRGILRRGIKHNVVLGHEISGQVAEVGPSVTSFTVGDRVVATLTTFCGQCQNCLSGREYRCPHGQGIGHAIDGGFAEFVALPERSLVSVPEAVDLVEASLLACPIGVSLQALRDVAQIKKGEVVLVVGAGGGLGVHAVQVASRLGARVMAVTTSPDKVAPLEELGCCEVILSNELDFSEVALAMTEDRGVDAVINMVGSPALDASLRSLAQFGRMVLLGEITRNPATIRLAEILFRDASILGSTGAGRRHIVDSGEMVELGQIKSVISQQFALEDAVQAYSLMLDKKTFGRVVLMP